MNITEFLVHELDVTTSATPSQSAALWLLAKHGYWPERPMFADCFRVQRGDGCSFKWTRFARTAPEANTSDANTALALAASLIAGVELPCDAPNWTIDRIESALDGYTRWLVDQALIRRDQHAASLDDKVQAAADMLRATLHEPGAGEYAALLRMVGRELAVAT